MEIRKTSQISGEALSQFLTDFRGTLLGKLEIDESEEEGHSESYTLEKFALVESKKTDRFDRIHGINDAFRVSLNGYEGPGYGESSQSYAFITQGDGDSVREAYDELVRNLNQSV